MDDRVGRGREDRRAHRFGERGRTKAGAALRHQRDQEVDTGTAVDPAETSVAASWVRFMGGIIDPCPVLDTTVDFRFQMSTTRSRQRDLDNEPCVDGRSWTDEMVRDVTNMMQPAATR